MRYEEFLRASASRDVDRVAIAHEKGRTTYAELDALADRFAAALISGAGFARGERCDQATGAGTHDDDRDFQRSPTAMSDSGQTGEAWQRDILGRRHPVSRVRPSLPLRAWEATPAFPSGGFFCQ